MVKNDNGIKTYRMFGTIENPCTELRSIVIAHYERFDGVFDPDLIISPKPIFSKDDMKLIFIDMGSISDSKIIKDNDR